MTNRQATNNQTDTEKSTQVQIDNIATNLKQLTQ